MISNDDVARTLERIADLLEIRGENPFKVRAYRLAANQAENLAEPLADIVRRDGDLRGIGGFGAAIAEKVGELIDTGRMSFLESLEREVPVSLLAVRELAGIGPRTAAMLWKEAGITSLEQLEAAAHSGGLAGLPRLGPKTVEKIVHALEHRSGGTPSRRPRQEIAALAEELRAQVEALPAVARAEIAGSYRRLRDTVGDLDVLAATSHPSAVSSGFVALKAVEGVIARGETKCSVLVAHGFQVDCRAVAVHEFGAALQYFTGSQAHNIQLRGRALRLGMTLNEYGLFRLDDGMRVAGEEEIDVYEALGLEWIPPERREGRGEIEASVLAGTEVHVRGRPVTRAEV
ncbi:MAG TPA: helix-hairpin-helix domain-containing protein [Candidatus Dormibacteraeota bacterium]|nr:helix-hairpin-helix domain-containing protein [Candidatus Dormibacteraeota bacterium]